MSRIWFGTNRNPVVNEQGVVVDFDGNFSAEGLQDLRFGVAEVVDGRMVSISVAPSSPEQAGSEAVFSLVKEQMKQAGRDTIALLHGYATSFRQAVEGAEKTKQAYGLLNPNMVLFSWPSDGRHAPHDYGNDRHDAKASGLAFARGLMKLVEFMNDGDNCGRRLHLLAHSMGNYVLRHALLEMAKMREGSRLPCVFDNILSMAADEDADAFTPAREDGQKWERLPELAKAVHIYINKHDKALLGSNFTKGNAERMGNTGPAQPHNLPMKVTVIDTSKEDGLLDIVGHGYYDTEPKVVRDVLHVLSGLAPNKVPQRTWVPGSSRYELG